MAQLKAEIDGEVGKIADSLYNAIPQRVKQLYATWGGTPFLDRNYTIFGFLVSGYDVLDKMSKVETRKANPEGQPVMDVKIIAARVLD
jgi:peptidyl-prolyl cis-trans isomerase B (cyclophilin B)